MVIRNYPRAYAATDPECKKECGNAFLPWNWPCYAVKRIHDCKGSTGFGDIYCSGVEDTEPYRSQLCAKDCNAPGENYGKCRSDKSCAGCGGFSVFNEIGNAASAALNIPKPWLVLGGGLIGVLILVLILRRRR